MFHWVTLWNYTSMSFIFFPFLIMSPCSFCFASLIRVGNSIYSNLHVKRTTRKIGFSAQEKLFFNSLTPSSFFCQRIQQKFYQKDKRKMKMRKDSRDNERLMLKYMHLLKVAMKYQIEWHWCRHTLKVIHWKKVRTSCFPSSVTLSSWKRMYKYVSHLQKTNIPLKVSYRSVLNILICVFSCELKAYQLLLLLQLVRYCCYSPDLMSFWQIYRDTKESVNC